MRTHTHTHTLALLHNMELSLEGKCHPTMDDISQMFLYFLFPIPLAGKGDCEALKDRRVIRWKEERHLPTKIPAMYAKNKLPLSLCQ